MSSSISPSWIYKNLSRIVQESRNYMHQCEQQGSFHLKSYTPLFEPLNSSIQIVQSLNIDVTTFSLPCMTISDQDYSMKVFLSSECVRYLEENKYNIFNKSVSKKKNIKKKVQKTLKHSLFRLKSYHFTTYLNATISLLEQEPEIPKIYEEITPNSIVIVCTEIAELGDPSSGLLGDPSSIYYNKTLKDGINSVDVNVLDKILPYLHLLKKDLSLPDIEGRVITTLDIPLDISSSIENILTPYDCIIPVNQQELIQHFNDIQKNPSNFKYEYYTNNNLVSLPLPLPKFLSSSNLEDFQPENEVEITNKGLSDEKEKQSQIEYSEMENKAQIIIEHSDENQSNKPPMLQIPKRLEQSESVLSDFFSEINERNSANEVTPNKIDIEKINPVNIIVRDNVEHENMVHKIDEDNETNLDRVLDNITTEIKKNFKSSASKPKKAKKNNKYNQLDIVFQNEKDTNYESDDFSGGIKLIPKQSLVVPSTPIKLTLPLPDASPRKYMTPLIQNNNTPLKNKSHSPTKNIVTTTVAIIKSPAPSNLIGDVSNVQTPKKPQDIVPSLGINLKENSTFNSPSILLGQLSQNYIIDNPLTSSSPLPRILSSPAQHHYEHLIGIQITKDRLNGVITDYESPYYRIEYSDNTCEYLIFYELKKYLNESDNIKFSQQSESILSQNQSKNRNNSFPNSTFSNSLNSPFSTSNFLNKLSSQEEQYSASTIEPISFFLSQSFSQNSFPFNQLAKSSQSSIEEFSQFELKPNKKSVKKSKKRSLNDSILEIEDSKIIKKKPIIQKKNVVVKDEYDDEELEVFKHFTIISSSVFDNKEFENTFSASNFLKGLTEKFDNEY